MDQRRRKPFKGRKKLRGPVDTAPWTQSPINPAIGFPVAQFLPVPEHPITGVPSGSETWLRLGRAAQLVKTTLRVSLGYACAILCMAGEDDTVRSRGADRVRQWAKIDPENEILIDGFSRPHEGVEISGDYLRYWLKRHRPELEQKPANPTAAPASAGPQSTTTPTPVGGVAGADRVDGGPANDLAAAVDESCAEAKAHAGKRGRKPGSGRIDDGTHLTKMLHLLAAEGAPSAWAAARQVSGGKASTQRRLHSKFSEKWGTEPPSGKTWKDVEDESKIN